MNYRFVHWCFLHVPSEFTSFNSCMCVSSETSLPGIVCSPVLDRKEWPRSETLEWLETSTGWYQLDVFFLNLFSKWWISRQSSSSHSISLFPEPAITGKAVVPCCRSSGCPPRLSWRESLPARLTPGKKKKKKRCAAKHSVHHANCNGSSNKAKMLFVNILISRGCWDKRYSCHQLSLSSKVQVSARQNSICT